MTGTESGPGARYRFGAFEADATTGELRRQGIRVRLNGQPFQLLLMLLERPGELLPREEIARALWPEGTFVDAEHGVNSAINRIREALGDTAAGPRFVETLARRGYRFVAPVERIGGWPNGQTRFAQEAAVAGEGAGGTGRDEDPAGPEIPRGNGILPTAEELPRMSSKAAQTWFVLLQLMYVGFYVGALGNLAEIQELLSVLSRPMLVFVVLVVTAALLIPVRAFLLTAVVLRAPRIRERYLRLWPVLLVADELWALSPFLLLHHITFGLALAAMAVLVYAPFAQRSLVLMGAGGAGRTDGRGADRTGGRASH
jgi:cholera toxin transcriptional activator